MARNILHCDMNNFYASVECMLNPALKEYPVAVCGSVEERHGIVLAKNYKAKAFDVKTGDTVWQAQQKCRDLVIVPPHYEEYIKYSKLARSVYERYTDQVEPYGMDECWLDITGTGSLFGSPVEVANKIRETIKFELGLTISVGVSFNKIFAKLGSDMKKPDAVTVIPKDTFREKIWKLPSADLLGVGRATQRTLDSYGIRTIGALAQTDPEFLRSVLGKNGVALWNYANGNDLSLVAKKDFVSPIKSVGHGITTVADLEKPEQVWPVFLELTQDIGHKLRVHGLSAEGVKKTFGLWIYKEEKKENIRCLCSKCLKDYIHNPDYIVRRLDPFAKVKDHCDKCNQSGWDYVIAERQHNARGKGCQNV